MITTDVVVNVGDAGKRKPDPDFYVYMLKQLKIEPGCCIFIDDRYCYYSLNNYKVDMVYLLYPYSE